MVACLAATIGGRQRPDFSGTWVATTDVPKGRELAPTAILGPRFGLGHSGERLALTRLALQDVRVVTFPLDGSRTSYRVPGRTCESDREITETAAWEGDAIALTIVQQIPPGGGTPLNLNAKRILRREGDTLVVEGTRTDARGTRQVATVYRRSSESMPAPKPAPDIVTAPAAIDKVAWISGTWIGTSSTTTTEERWTPAASGSILAVSRTLRSGQMSSWEFLCISQRGGSLVYTAMPDGRTTPTDFTLTAVTAESATFENPAHDYPTLIRYSLKPDGSLETTIAGPQGARPLSVLLKRQ